MKRPWEDNSIAANGATVRENFTVWFSGSKVVDELGAPSVFYHSTTHDFDVFDQGSDKFGFHFGTFEQANQRLLSHRVDGRQGSENIIPVFLCIKNPLRMKDCGNWASDDDIINHLSDLFFDDEFDESWSQALHRLSARGIEDSGLKDCLIEMGYDGIIYANMGESPNAWDTSDFGGSDSYIAFHSSQVKSAVGNSGLYLKDGNSLTDNAESQTLNAAARARLAVRGVDRKKNLFLLRGAA